MLIRTKTTLVGGGFTLEYCDTMIETSLCAHILVVDWLSILMRGRWDTFFKGKRDLKRGMRQHTNVRKGAQNSDFTYGIEQVE